MKQTDELIIQKIVLVQYSRSKLKYYEKKKNISIARQRVEKLEKINSKLDFHNIEIGKKIIKFYIDESETASMNFIDFAEWCLKKNNQFNISNIELQILEKRKDILLRNINTGSKLNILDWFLENGIRELGYDFMSNIFSRKYSKFKVEQCNIGIHSYFDTGIGIGNYARYLSQKISNKNKIQEINLPHPRYNGLHIQDNIKDINIFVIGLDQTLNIDLFYNTDELRKKYNILVPFWEMENVKSEYIQAIKVFEEIWAPTKFIYNIFKGTAPIIRQLPVLTDNLKPKKFKRKKRNEKPGYFLNIFDLASGKDRKNLLGTIEVFKKYRETYGTDEKLIFKVYSSQSETLTINDIIKKDFKVLKKLGIHFIEGYVSKQELKTLIDDAIAIISLHKSEGLGLSIIEAMSQSKKVIVTNYGGVTDFCNRENAYLVDYKLCWKKNSRDLIYSDKIKWACPKIETAVLQIHAASLDYWNKNYAKEIQAIKDINRIVEDGPKEIDKLMNKMLVREKISTIF